MGDIFTPSYNKFRLYNPETKTEFTDIFEINTLEIPKLPKEAKDEETERWLWLKFLDAKNEEEYEMLSRTTPEIAKAVHMLEVMSQDEDTRFEYEARQKSLRDYNMYINSAKEEGKQIGLQKGKEIGLQKGEQIGLQKGEQIGLQKGKREMAKRMLKANIDINQIAQFSGLSVEEIKSLE